MYYNSKEVKDILGVSIRDTTMKLSLLCDLALSSNIRLYKLILL